MAQYPPSSSARSGYLAALLLGLIGLGLLAGCAGVVRLFAFDVIPTYLAARQWPSTSGQLEDVALRHVSATEARSSGESWQLRVRYRYRVDGHDYHGERAGLRDRAGRYNSGALRALHRRLDMAWTQKRDVVVRYAPDDPQRALLDLRLPGSQLWVGGLLLVVLMPAGLALSFAAWQALRDARRH